MEEISSIPAASSPPVPVQPPAKPKTFLLVALGLVLMLGLLFTGVILGQKGFLSGILPVQKSSSTMVPQPTPTPDPTISWTDYVNSEKGYRLKYPSAIFVRVNCPKEELLLRKRNEGETINEENPPNCNRDSRYSVEIVTNDISFTGGIPKGNQYYQVTQEEVSVDQVKATKYTITLISKPNFPYVEWEQQVIFTKGDKKYFLYFANKELENYYSQILSTFKFLDEDTSQSNATANWKTYTNQRYGYAVKYPKDWDVREWDNSGSPLTTIQHTVELKRAENLLQVNVWHKPIDSSLASWLADTFRQSGGVRGRIQLPEMPNSEVLGIPAFETYVEGTAPAYVLIFAKGSRVYEIYMFGKRDAEPRATYDQILSSFKFIE